MRPPLEERYGSDRHSEQHFPKKSHEYVMGVS